MFPTRTAPKEKRNSNSLSCFQTWGRNAGWLQPKSALQHVFLVTKTIKKEQVKARRTRLCLWFARLPRAPGDPEALAPRTLPGWPSANLDFVQLMQCVTYSRASTQPAAILHKVPSLPAKSPLFEKKGMRSCCMACSPRAGALQILLRDPTTSAPRWEKNIR